MTIYNASLKINYYIPFYIIIYNSQSLFVRTTWYRNLYGLTDRHQILDRRLSYSRGFLSNIFKKFRPLKDINM